MTMTRAARNTEEETGIGMINRLTSYATFARLSAIAVLRR